MRRSIPVNAWFCASLASLALAQEPAPPPPAQEPILSGPVSGSPLHPVRVYAESGERKGQEFDAVAALGTPARALLFIHDLSRNTAPLIRAFAALESELGARGYAGWCVLLSDDRTAAEARLQAVNGSLKLARPIVLSLDGLEGPGAYALNRRCTLTLVLAKDGVVTRSVGFTDTGAADAPKLRAWIEELLPPPPTPEERRAAIAAGLPKELEALKQLAVEQALELERMRAELAALKAQRGGVPPAPMREERPMRERARESERPAARERAGEPPTPPAGEAPGKAPTDPELSRLLRAVIRKDASDEVVRARMSEIEERAKESEALRAEAVAMFVRVLHYGEHYGTELARAEMRAFVAAHQK
jgi:hypothetical protein